MRIALIDLNHMTVGVHTNTVPLGIGLIARYLKNNVAHKFDIKIFKDATKFLDILKEWKPDVLGISQYAWNSELNLYMAGVVKNRNPNCLVVAGGPNLCLSAEEKTEYLQKNSSIDLCVSHDGEIPFSEVVRRLIGGEDIEDICLSPVAGAYSIRTPKGSLAESKEPPPRLNSLDVFGSMYAEGFFEDLLNEAYHPFLQTQRGCPFRCTYCHTGNSYYSRMIFQSVEYFKRDMEYLGKRFAGRHNIPLYMANTNFGFYKEDFDVARAIRDIQDKYDWPKNIYLNSANKPKQLLELLSILKYKFLPAMALQTLTPKVLKNINRKNLPFKEFVAFQKKVSQNMADNTATELILNLPGETKESFLNTISSVLNSGVQNIVIFTLMSLRGTEIASRQTRERCAHSIRTRIVPRAFSEINGIKIFEPEEVVVGTKSMPFADYLDLRGLALLITVFASSVEMFPIRKFLMEHKIDIASWIFAIQDNISNFSGLHSIYKSFLRETEDELFPSYEALKEFFNRQENYELLCAGKFGDNLLRKYKTILLSQYYRKCLQLAFSQLRHIVGAYFEPQLLDSLINDLQLYVKSRDIGDIFKQGIIQKETECVALHYDIPKWFAQGDRSLPLENYKGLFFYSVTLTDYVRKRLESFRQMNRDPGLSLQILYRDGYIKDFWPQWVANDTKAKKN